MRTKSKVAFGAALLLAALGFGGAVNKAAADVRVNVNLGPPPIVVAQPPSLVLVPGSEIYFVPQVDLDVFYYRGYWFSPRGDRWYRSRAYDGPWRVVERRYVPAPVYRLPREDYRRHYYRERHIPYGQWKKERLHHERGGRVERDGRHEGRGRDHDRGEHRGRGDRGEHGDRR